MAQFKFKYQPVKQIKERLEKKAQKELAEINIHIEQCIMHKEKLAEELRIKKGKITSKTKVSEIQFQKDYEKYMCSMIDQVQKKIDELEIERKEKRLELIEKSKQLKIFNSLEGKHFQKYKENENKSEMKSVDEVATQKFIRGKQ